MGLLDSCPSKLPLVFTCALMVGCKSLLWQCRDQPAGMAVHLSKEEVQPHCVPCSGPSAMTILS